MICCEHCHTDCGFDCEFYRSARQASMDTYVAQRQVLADRLERMKTGDLAAFTEELLYLQNYKRETPIRGDAYDKRRNQVIELCPITDDIGKKIAFQLRRLP